MNNDLLNKLIEQNAALREARQAIPVNERVVVPAGAITRVEARESSGLSAYRVAKVGQADRPTQNRRVYTTPEWARNIATAMENLIPSGKLTGAVDHAGMLDGGSLKDTAILWKKLEMHSDGSVDGEFAVIDGHSRGKDLAAQINSGMAIGFSTSGYATGRQPTAEERIRYGIPEDDSHAVIIENWCLKKIDAVDDPAVIDAWTKDSVEPAAAERSAIGSFAPETPMKSLAELKDKHPELFALHEKAISDAVAAIAGRKDAEVAAAKAEAATIQGKLAEAEKASVDLTARLAEQSGRTAGLSKYLFGVMEALGKTHGMEVPYREVAAKEAAEKIGDLARTVEAKDAELATLKAQVEKAAQEKAVHEAAAKDAARKAAVQAKAAELLKGHRFAGQINKLVAKLTDSARFDVAALEAFIAEKTAEYKAVAALQQPETGITGVTHQDDQPADESAEEPLPIAKAMAESL